MAWGRRETYPVRATEQSISLQLAYLKGIEVFAVAQPAREDATASMNKQQRCERLVFGGMAAPQMVVSGRMCLDHGSIKAWLYRALWMTKMVARPVCAA